jgi:predicted RNase H-like HicB family nuclease
MKKYCLSLIFYPQDTGGYHVSCPEIDGCFSAGNTYEEAEANIKDLIADLLEERANKVSEVLFREGLCMRGKSFHEIEVDVAENGLVIFEQEQTLQAANN